jgi:hypothetical protein
MGNRWRRTLAAGALAAGLLSGGLACGSTGGNGPDVPAPAQSAITYGTHGIALTPSSGQAGTRVTITGQGFTGSITVCFGDQAGTRVQVNAAGTELTVTAPAGSGDVGVSVENEKGTPGIGGSFTYTSSSGASGTASSSGSC